MDVAQPPGDRVVALSDDRADDRVAAGPLEPVDAGAPGVFVALEHDPFR